jgi:hypothetical protein
MMLFVGGIWKWMREKSLMGYVVGKKEKSGKQRGRGEGRTRETIRLEFGSERQHEER